MTQHHPDDIRRLTFTSRVQRIQRLSESVQNRQLNIALQVASPAVHKHSRKPERRIQIRLSVQPVLVRSLTKSLDVGFEERSVQIERSGTARTSQGGPDLDM